MAQPAAAGGRGPIGKPMNPITVGLLTLVTCGIYGLYWDYKTYEELKQHTGEGLGGVVGMLLCFVWVGYFMLPIEVGKMEEADGKPASVTAVDGLWLLIPIAGIFIYFNKVQGALNEYWVSKGATPVQ